jgi:hypothetical protein
MNLFRRLDLWYRQTTVVYIAASKHLTRLPAYGLMTPNRVRVGI